MTVKNIAIDVARNKNVCFYWSALLGVGYTRNAHSGLKIRINNFTVLLANLPLVINAVYACPVHFQILIFTNFKKKPKQFETEF